MQSSSLGMTAWEGQASARHYSGGEKKQSRRPVRGAGPLVLYTA